MTNRTCLITAVFILIAGNCIFSQDLNSVKLKDRTRISCELRSYDGLMAGTVKIAEQNIQRSLLADVKSDMLDVNNSSVNMNRNLKPADTKSKKSLILGGVLSAVLPGAGELYAGDYLKAAIFLGVEAASWGVYAYLNHKGDTKTADFQKYADTYWSVRKYAQWLVDNGFQNSGGINPNEPDLEVLRNEIMVSEQSNFSHTLPPYRSQQYYELIGKYQNFQAGWTNLQHDPTKTPGPYYYESYRDPVFVNYADSRQKANDFYDYATTSVWFVVLNHIVSAADGIWSVSKYNKKLTLQTGFRFNRVLSPYTLQYETMPTVNVAFNF